MDVHLVDGTYELFRHYHALPSALDANGQEVAAVRGVLTSILGMITDGATHLGVATDHVIESFRNGLWTGYKTSEGVEPDLLAQFPLLEEAVAAMGMTVWPMVEFEADDALASAAAIAARDRRVQRVVICTPDKDLAQCVTGTRIVQLNRRTRTVIDEAGVIAKFGVPPASIPDYLALVGDSADGYPGLRGWGAKSAAAILARFGHIEAIPEDFRLWRANVASPGTLAATLVREREHALLFRTLATLRSDLPLFESVDRLRWTGPTPAFTALAARLDSANRWHVQIAEVGIAPGTEGRVSVLEVSSVRSAFVPFSKSAIEGLIPSRFEEQAERHPDRLAVKAETTSWTYAELNRIANRIAHGILDARGSIVEPVVLALEQGPLLIATILGTLKAGKIYVPVDADLPPQRIREVMEDSQAGLILGGTRAARSDGPFAGVSVLAAQDLADRSSSHNPALPIGPEAAAYIYYTSGSTGRPKGVFNLHRNVLHNIRRYTNSLQISSDDRLTLLQRPSFSGAVSSLFGALLNGAAVFPFDVAHEGVDRVAPWLAREAITIYHSVPALFRMVAARIGPLPELRLIRLEGDQASVTDVELFRSRFSRQAVLVNGLGATECGLVRQYFIGFDTPTPDGLVPVGFPVEDMSVRVVDETGNDVRTGDVGEMCVRSRYLAPGYWRRPDLTAAAFASDETDPGERLYRTGDLGRLRSDGCLDYLGRRDRRVKIRGQLVEIADVEAALVAMPDVREAAVVVREDGGVEPRLVAYIGTSAAPSTDARRSQT